MSEFVKDVLDPLDLFGSDAAKEAQGKNEKNVQGGLKAIRSGYGQALDVTRSGLSSILSDIEGLGESSRQGARDAYDQSVGGYRQTALGRGLSSSTVAESYTQGARSRLVSDLASINEGLSRLRSDVRFQGLGLETGLLTGQANAEAGFRSGNQYVAPPSFLQQLGGAGGVASALAAFSDARLKRGLRPVGRVGRHTLYEWTWPSGAPGRGVLAQEVERCQPEAVSFVGGFRVVNYGEL